MTKFAHIILQKIQYIYWFSTVDKFSPVISYWLCKHGMLYIYCVYYYSLPERLCNKHMKNKYHMTHSWEWPYVPFNKNGDCETMKVLLSCFVCYEQSDFPKKVITIFIMSLYIHDISDYWLGYSHVISMVCHGRDHMAVRYSTSCAISAYAYHH